MISPADYDLPKLRIALESYMSKHMMTSAPSKKIRQQMKVTKIQMQEHTAIAMDLMLHTPNLTVNTISLLKSALHRLRMR